MKRTLLYFTTVLFVLAIALTQTGCKEDTVIRANAAPNVAGINVVAIPDTFTMITKSLYIDTLNTSVDYSTTPVIHGLGIVEDPYLGRTVEGMYFQVEPTASNFLFSSVSYNIDSAFVILPYVGKKWGDTNNSNSIQSISAYQVISSMTKGTNYYTNQRQNIDANAISDPYQMDIKKLTLDSMLVNGASVPYHLRIPLKRSFIDKIDAAVKDGTNFTTTAAFLSYFNGLCIQPTDTTNGHGTALAYFNLEGSTDYDRAAIAFYYHQTTGDTSLKVAFFNFVKSDCVHYNWVSRNYNTAAAPVRNALVNYSSTLNTSDSIVVFQNLPGATIDVRVPYIKNLPTGIVNRAQLIFTQVSLGNSSADTAFGVASLMYPMHINSDNSVSKLLDFQLSDNNGAFAFTDGTPTVIVLGGGIIMYQYTLNIPREIQAAITQKWDQLHLRIYGTPTFPAAYHLVAGGRTNSMYKTQLLIYYSKPQ